MSIDEVVRDVMTDSPNNGTRVSVNLFELRSVLAEVLRLRGENQLLKDAEHFQHALKFKERAEKAEDELATERKRADGLAGVAEQLRQQIIERDYDTAMEINNRIDGAKEAA